MRALKLITVAAVLIFASSVVRADGLDGRVNVNGGGPGSPPCGSLQFFADANGDFTVDCTTTVNTPSITFAALDSQTNGGLSCLSNLTMIGWTNSSSMANGIDACTFTAPTSVSTATILFLISIGDPYKGFNDGDCDLDDFVLGIAKGCDVKVTTSLPFTPGAVGDLSVNGAPLLPFPEPASLGLLATGLTALFVGRRRKNARTEA
ncbi:MAG TPA: PEP-CTERM sorting domain-containing protein [Candidatus Acidoferrales bacterium]|nr:PEP-CTERM sorting domain-containing protein [Candidatus Acidoferrales bacterium]